MNIALREQYDRYETEYLVEMSARDLTEEARAALDDVLHERGVSKERVAEAVAKPEAADRLTRAVAIQIDLWGTMFIIAIITMPFMFISEQLHTGVATSVWFVYFLSRDWIPGGSLGKRAFGIRVVSMDTGKHCTWQQSALRSLALMVPFDWVPILGQRRMRIGDMVAGTEVVQRARVSETGHG